MKKGGQLPISSSSGRGRAWQKLIGSCPPFFFGAYVVVICWLSLTPAPPQIENEFFGWDKVQHVGAYTVFTLLAGWAFGAFGPGGMRRWWWAIAAAVIFGGGMEIAQGAFTVARAAEWGDLLADLIGAVGAYGLVMVLKRS